MARKESERIAEVTNTLLKLNKEVAQKENNNDSVTIALINNYFSVAENYMRLEQYEKAEDLYYKSGIMMEDYDNYGPRTKQLLADALINCQEKELAIRKRENAQDKAHTL